MANATTIQQFLASPNSYTIINVGGEISEVDLAKLCAALKVNTTLTTLHLVNNQIGDAGAAAIAEELKGNNTTLTTLSLYHNQIGNAGAKLLAEVLKTNNSLTSLNLEYNQIKDAISNQIINDILEINKIIAASNAYDTASSEQRTTMILSAG